MKNNVYCLILFITALSLCGCEKVNKDFPEGEISIHLLDDFQVDDANPSAFVESTVIPRTEALLAYSELLAYNSKEHFFTLNQEAVDRIDTLEPQISFEAFGVYLGEELVYTGFFWPSYSSAMCHSIIIDPFLKPENKLYVRLGYPGYSIDKSIPDKRNDNRILGVFERDGKLAE